MEHWQVDLVNVQKYKSPQNHHASLLLTCIDCFSKYAWVVPLTNKSDPKVANAIRTLFRENGVPRYVQTDNGSEFLGPFDAVLEERRVQHIKRFLFYQNGVRREVQPRNDTSRKASQLCEEG